MTYYFHIQDNKIISKGQAKLLNGDNIEVNEDIYNHSERYIYQDSEIILDPDYEVKQVEKEAKKIAQLKLTKREVFLALYKNKGITPEEIKASITNTEALIEFEYAAEYYRGNPLINVIGNSLGYTKEELDYLFINKTFPTNFEENTNLESEV